MGLIKAALGSAGGVLADQWKEYFYCDSMAANVLVTKGKKRTSSRNSNTKGSDNIISNGSVVAVNEGQCMMIVEQGKIVEFAAEAGEYTWNSSSEPTIFQGGLEGLEGSWETLKRRFAFGGDTAKDQRVYFFNLKELVGNKYGTPAPIPFRVVDNNIGLDMDVSIRCNGEYSYKIADPMLFYKNVCGNVSQDYTRDQLDSQLKSEFLTALQPAFARISALGIRYSALPGHTMELAQAMNEVLSGKWGATRGLAIVAVGVNSVTASAEDEATIKELQKSAVFRNTNMAAAHMVQAQAEAMKTAAGNKNGAMMGFMGMNMAAVCRWFQRRFPVPDGSAAARRARSCRPRCSCYRCKHLEMLLRRGEYGQILRGVRRFQACRRLGLLLRRSQQGQVLLRMRREEARLRAAVSL